MSDVTQPPDEAGASGSQEAENRRTPYWEAAHSARYERQVLIEQIESVSRRTLICYVAGGGAYINRDDVLGFADLLCNVPNGADLDLLIQTPGGDLDAAEKLIHVVRERVAGGSLRVIVPDYAKSAGTLIALGADAVVMSDTSELGPIDPQVMRADGDGNRLPHSVDNYIDAYDSLCEELARNPGSVSAQIMLRKLDPSTVKLFRAVRSRARNFAEKYLRKYMLNPKPPRFEVSAVAGSLLDTQRWRSHGQMISYEDARDIGLVVEYLPQEHDDWQRLWALYCRQRLALDGPEDRLFESNHVSVNWAPGA